MNRFGKPWGLERVSGLGIVDTTTDPHHGENERILRLLRLILPRHLRLRHLCLSDVIRATKPFGDPVARQRTDLPKLNQVPN
jgi:hypothetical protein